MPSKAAELYKHYASAFSAISDQERRKILASTVETEVVYRIPRMEGTDHQIIIDDIHEFQAKWPGGKFALHSVSEHHDLALMEWQLIRARQWLHKVGRVDLQRSLSDWVVLRQLDGTRSIMAELWLGIRFR